MNVKSSFGRTPSAIKRAIIKSYWRQAPFSLQAFLTVRTMLLPLEKFNREIPESGVIVEVGCGHGIIAQYLARRHPDRRIIAIEPDGRRLAVARKAGDGLWGIEWREGYLEAGMFVGLDALVFLGVLYLVDDSVLKDLLRTCRSSLKTGGTLLISDTFLDGSVVQRFQFQRERFFKRIGFTKGDVIHYRTEGQWRSMLAEAGFSRVSPFEAPVFLHSTFNWICR